MKNKLNIVISVLAVLALLLTACATPTTEAPKPTAAPAQPTAVPATKAPEPTKVPEVVKGDPYTIGAFLSSTGPASSLGQPEVDTVNMMAEQFNKAGGIKGPDGKMHEVVVKMYDDQSDPTKAVEAVKKIVESDKAVVIVGGTSSGASVAVNETVTKAKVPFISVASSSAIVTKADGSQHEWVFKTPQQNLPVAMVQIDWLKAKGFTKIASVGVNDAFGKDSMAAMKKAAADAKINLVWEGTFEPKTTDFSAQITAIKAAAPEAVIVHAVPAEGAPFTVQYRDLGLKFPLVHNHGIGNQAFIDTAKAAANGVMFPIGKILVIDQLAANDPQKPVIDKYIADYKAKFNKAPSSFGGHAWDAMIMVKMALEAVGPDSAKIRDYLETKIVKFVGISGIFTIDAKDHTGIGKESLVMVQIKDGKWAYVDPKDYAKVP